MFCRYDVYRVHHLSLMCYATLFLLKDTHYYIIIIVEVEKYYPNSPWGEHKSLHQISFCRQSVKYLLCWLHNDGTSHPLTSGQQKNILSAIILVIDSSLKSFFKLNSSVLMNSILWVFRLLIRQTSNVKCLLKLWFVKFVWFVWHFTLHFIDQTIHP